MNRRLVLTGIIALVAIALAVTAYVVISGGGTAATDATASLKLKLTSWDRSLGADDAPIQVVEYGAPSCPVCAYWNKTVFPTFKKEYVDTGKVHYTFRVFALRPVDLGVEAMARCLPEKRYFSFIDMMFRNQSQWDPDGYRIDDVQAALYLMGDKANMTAVEVDRCTRDKAQLSKIAAVGEYAQKTFGIHSTPSFMIDGVFHQRDFMTLDGMRKVLDAELKKTAH